MVSGSTTAIRRPASANNENRAYGRSASPVSGNAGQRVLEDQFAEGVISIRIHGLPKPQGSKTFKGLSNRGHAILTESSKGAKPWRQDVKLDSREQYRGPLIVGPVFMSIVFYVPRPKGHYKTIAKQVSNVIKDNAPVYSTSCGDGDIDKLVRCTLDGLSAKCGGCVIADDSLVVRLSCEKRYVTQSEACGACITVVQS